MSKVYMVDSKVLLCERCDSAPAQFFTVAPTPSLSYEGICARCAGEICLSLGDKAGYDKFMERVI